MLEMSPTQSLDLRAPDPGYVRRSSRTGAAAIAGDLRRAKLRRLAHGGKPRVLDLFAGCGGMSLGFLAAGYSISGAVELDPIAAESHATNFYSAESGLLRAKHSVPRDITAVPAWRLSHELELGAPSGCVDVLVGGPPCQAFARVGRAKLREIAEHPEAFKYDSRASLYVSFMEYVTAFQPIAVVMENVPDIMNFGGHNIPEEICEALEQKGYVARYTLLNSVRYGVPQMRERMFLVAYVREMGLTPIFPSPTHWHELPRGYEGTRQVAFKNVLDLFSSGAHVCPTPHSPLPQPPAVTAFEAIGDLPRITLHLEGRLRRGARRFTDWDPYPKGVRLSRYAEAMRSWPGFSANGGIYDHVIRYLPRDYPIFARMNPGDQYPEAYRLALRMLDEAVSSRLAYPSPPGEKAALHRKLKSEIVPPYDYTKFPNKWRKMEADAPARTLMAHLGKDSYSHIHYDSTQARTISVREAARLQSFPDGFRFCGTMNPAFRQIGNAVPPLMAKAIAAAIRRQLPGSG